MVESESLYAHDPMPRPYVLKPVNEGSSVGVAIVTEDGNYGNPIGRDVPGPWNEFDDLLAEPFIKGRELTVAVLNGEPLAVTELKIDNGFYDYEHKYTDGRTVHVCPADVPDDIAAAMLDMAAKAHQIARLQGRVALRLPLGRRAGRGGPLPARNQHPAGHDPAQPGPRAGALPRHRLWRAGRAADRRGARNECRPRPPRRVAARQAAQGRAPRSAVPKTIAKQAAGRPGARQPARGLVFAGFPARHRAGRADRARHSGQGASARPAVAIGRAGFTVNGYQIVGLSNMEREPIDAVVNEELRRPPPTERGARPSQTLVDVGAIRQRLLHYGWVKDARVLAPAARHPGHRHRRAAPRGPVAEQAAAGADRRRRRGARPRADRPHARSCRC